MLNGDFVYAKQGNCVYQKGNTQCVAANLKKNNVTNK